MCKLKVLRGLLSVSTAHSWFRAMTAADAVLIAKEKVEQEWASGKYQTVSSGNTPALEVESAEESGFFSSLTFKKSGYVFYPAE